jgi:hypothetical protein
MGDNLLTRAQQNGGLVGEVWFYRPNRKTPLWARLSGLRYTHVAFRIGGVVWQVSRQGSEFVMVEDMLRRRCPDHREVVVFNGDIPFFRVTMRTLPSVWAWAQYKLLRRTPKPPFNCVSAVCDAIGIDRLAMPDQLYERLRNDPDTKPTEIGF